jgi:hypothetical protein
MEEGAEQRLSKAFAGAGIMHGMMSQTRRSFPSSGKPQALEEPFLAAATLSGQIGRRSPWGSAAVGVLACAPGARKGPRS